MIAMKKNLAACLFLLSLGHLASGQEYKTRVSAPDQRIIFELPAHGVVIEGHAGDELVIKASDSVKPAPERAKGLKPVYYGSVDNSGIGLSVQKEGNTIKIEKATRQEIRYTIKVPAKASVTFQQLEFQGDDDIVIRGLGGDLEVKANQAGIRASGISGAVVANSISGNIEVKFTSLPTGKTVAISTISGDIDMALPAAAKGNLTMKALDGEIYTDFDIQHKGTDKETGSLRKIAGGNTLQGTINGGGTDVRLNVISGDIFLRKVQR